MSDAAWQALGAASVLLCTYLLWALELVLWQQALLALLALHQLVPRTVRRRDRRLILDDSMEH